MRQVKSFILLSVLLLISSCITQFIPETDENQELLVVNGLISDQPEVNTIKLSKSLPLGRTNLAKPLEGCAVSITDDLDNLYNLTEQESGTYVTDVSTFRGIIGRKYKLHIRTNSAYGNNYSYESLSVEMKPVPPIDSIFYEKRIIPDDYGFSMPQEGCQIYLNTHDPNDNCKYYRWDFTETWEFRIPYTVPNWQCWFTNNSGLINIKNTTVLTEDRINRYPLNFISNKTDRLKVKYSIMVNQYSLNKDEFDYWEKLQTITEDVGSLYDITPAAIPSNIYCIENPNEKVLGYFSVSASSSKRFFIKDNFSGIINLYSDCISDTIFGTQPIPNENISVWVLEDQTIGRSPPYRVVTGTKGCADCTERGTKIEPLFWNDKK